MMCKKCWEDAQRIADTNQSDFWDEYVNLTKERRGNPCTELQQKFGNQKMVRLARGKNYLEAGSNEIKEGIEFNGAWYAPQNDGIND